MKIQSDKASAFRAIDLTIHIESAEEARALWAIFNHAKNTRFLPSTIAAQLRRAIGQEYEAYDEIANGVTYAEFYR